MMRTPRCQLIPVDPRTAVCGPAVMLLDGDKLYAGWLCRQKPNDQMKWCMDWRELNLPGQALPYGEGK